MQKYRKKPRMVEASDMLCDNNVEQTIAWVQDNGGNCIYSPGYGLRLGTLNGMLWAMFGERIVLEKCGEFSVYSERQFMERFEYAEETLSDAEVLRRADREMRSVQGGHP